MSCAVASVVVVAAPNNLPILTAARVVCRESFNFGGDVLVHVGKLIDGFLDTFSTQENALLNACSGGASVQALEYLYYRSSERGRKMAIHVAAMAGHVHVLQWLVEHHQADFSVLRKGCLSPMDRAAQHGHLDAVMWLHANYAEGFSSATLALAAQCGNVKVLRWLHRHGTAEYASDAMVGAAAHNELKAVKWLHRHGCHDDAHAAIIKAAEYGHVPVVAWLYLNGSQEHALQAMLVAAGSGQLQIVKWLYENARQLEIGEHIHDLYTAVQLAATGGHTRVAVWLLNKPDQTRRHKRRRHGSSKVCTKRARLGVS